jgi:hypothetical protein
MEHSPVKEYDIFIPLNYNDGSPIEVEKIQDISRRLVLGPKRSGRRFLSRLKRELLRSLSQEEILIIERDIQTL